MLFSPFFQIDKLLQTEEDMVNDVWMEEPDPVVSESRSDSEEVEE